MPGPTTEIREVFRGVRGTVFVQPHSDDAVMFAGHMISQRLLPPPYFLLTVFSYSCYVVGDEFRKLRSDQIPPVRVEEDRRFCERFGLEYAGLGFHDAPLRRPENPEQREALKRTITRRLAECMRELGCGLCVVPRPSTGKQHEDHGIAWEAAFQATRDTRGLTLAIADDLPYSRNNVREPLAMNGDTYRPSLIHLTEEDLETKIDGLAIYRSQAPARYVEAIARPAPGDPNTSPSETLWILRHG